MRKDRVVKTLVEIDVCSIQSFYAQRAKEKIAIDIDAPVVLCGDKAPEKIWAWTQYELAHRLPLAEIETSSKVLEVGFGTGRISKYLTETAIYVGIDYVKEFVDIAKQRNDMKKGENICFLHGSLQELAEGKLLLPKVQFDRFVISGGVFMYMNDLTLQKSLGKLLPLLDEQCLMYISEPVAMQERLTLHKFYSDALETEYSAIYRTVAEYQALFAPFYQNGFQLVLQEAFFEEDIKEQKETKQWLFILRR